MSFIQMNGRAVTKKKSKRQKLISATKDKKL